MEALLSGLLLVVIAASLWMRLRTLTLVDAFLIAIAMFFGAYTLIDVALVDPGNRDPLAVALVFVQVGFSALVLWGYGRIRNLKEVRFSRLRTDFLTCPGWLLATVISCGLVYLWYSAQLFSGYNIADSAQLDTLELPYWFTSLGMVVNGAVFAAGLAVFAKWLYARGKERLFWFAVSLGSVAFIFGMGRRTVLGYLLMCGWLMFARQKRAVTVLMVALAIPVLIGLSNAYQVYRAFSYRGVPVTDLIDISQLGRAADIAETTSNLTQREAIWRFNYDIIKSDLDDKSKIQWGRLFASGIPNYIPSTLIGRKTIFDSEAELERAFGLEVYDRPSNVFAYTFGDFWYFGFLIAPMMIVFFVWVCVTALRRISDPFLRVMLMGMALFEALNIEASYLDPLGVARSFAILAVAYTICRLSWRAFRRLLHTAVPVSL